MKTHLPAPRIRKMWHRFTHTAGPFQGNIHMKMNKYGKMDELFVKCQFARFTTDFRILVNEKNQIAGFDPDQFPSERDFQPS